MTVTLTEPAMIALDRRLDQTLGFPGGPLESILTKTDRQQGAVSPELLRRIRRRSEGGRGVDGPEILLNSSANEEPQFVVVHSTHSN